MLKCHHAFMCQTDSKGTENTVLTACVNLTSKVNTDFTFFALSDTK